MTTQELHIREHRQLITRRWFLKQCGVGLGAVALNELLCTAAAQAAPAIGGVAQNPLAPKLPHFVARAKRVIYLFMAGAPSQFELFDHKPELAKWDGKSLPESLLSAA